MEFQKRCKIAAGLSSGLSQQPPPGRALLSLRSGGSPHLVQSGKGVRKDITPPPRATADLPELPVLHRFANAVSPVRRDFPPPTKSR